MGQRCPIRQARLTGSGGSQLETSWRWKMRGREDSALVKGTTDTLQNSQEIWSVVVNQKVPTLCFPLC